MSQAKDVLKVRGLSKKFTLHILGGKTIEGCTDVNFSLKTGEFMGIVGPSGAGKSTIIKCIYRTYLSSSGQILYSDAGGEEVDLARAPEDIIRRRQSKEEIGYVSQFLQVIPRVAGGGCPGRGAAAAELGPGASQGTGQGVPGNAEP